MTIPPFAVPSSLVSTMPVTVTASVKTRAWTTPFCPVVASSTSRVSSTGPCFSITRLTLPSSSISPVLVCRRPAVSMSTVSTRTSMPFLTASKAMLAGSPPSGPRTVWAPTRSPQVCSWSAAAARNVSAAPSRTVRPSATRTRASLPQVVVLPVPLTPTTRRTAGRPSGCGAVASVRSTSAPIAVTSSSRSRVRSCAWSRTPSTRTRVLSRSTSSVVAPTPMSACSRVSSTSSHVSSSTTSRESRANSPRPSVLCERASRARSRVSRPAVGSGTSSSGADGWGATTGAGSGSSTVATGRFGVSRGTSASSPSPGR